MTSEKRTSDIVIIPDDDDIEITKSSRAWNGTVSLTEAVVNANADQQTQEDDNFVDDEFRSAREDEASDLGPVDAGREWAKHDACTQGQDESPPVKRKCTFTRFRQVVGSIVNNGHFQTFIIILIIINAIMMGLATFDFVYDNPTVSAAFEKTDLAFLVIFTVELAMQFIYHGLYLFRDGWLVFDFVIIILSWALSSLQIIRAFRIFRALRLVTRVSVLRNLITALMSVLPRMAAISALLLLIFYIFAVMFTVLFSDLELSENYFVRLDASFFTLFQMMTLDWVYIARECMEIYHWAWAPFVVFIMITAFIVYNLIIAVVCDAVAMVEHGDEGETCEMSDDDECSNVSTNNVDSSGINISQARIRSLRDRIEQLTRNELEMQKSIDRALMQLGIECRDDIPSK